MTLDEILVLQPGPKMDALVGEQIMRECRHEFVWFSRMTIFTRSLSPACARLLPSIRTMPIRPSSLTLTSTVNRSRCARGRRATTARSGGAFRSGSGQGSRAGGLLANGCFLPTTTPDGRARSMSSTARGRPNMAWTLCASGQGRGYGRSSGAG